MHKKFFSKVLENINANERCWLATVIHTDGSTPAKVGMKMLITLNDTLHGTIGGGAVEIEVVNRIRKEQPLSVMKWGFDLDADSNLEKSGMVCGGVQEILVEPLFSDHDLYIVGGGHCGQALSELAARCDFNVTVIDDRSEVATQNNHPYASEVICLPYCDIDQAIRFSKETYIVVMTHGHMHDGLVVEKLLDKTHKYLGVIGSAKKTDKLFQRLQKAGHGQAALKNIFAPIGFPIGSQTPMEVAVSVLSQLIAVKQNKENIVFNSNPLRK